MICRVPDQFLSMRRRKNQQASTTYIQSTQTVDKFFTCKVIKAFPSRPPIFFISSESSLSCSSHAKASASHSNFRLRAFIPILTMASRGVRIICNARRTSLQRLKDETRRGWRTWKSINAIMVGGRAATLLGKSNERRRGGACRKAGKSARMVKIWN